jgi:hypothetical protein
MQAGEGICHELNAPELQAVWNEWKHNGRLCWGKYVSF